LGGGGGGVIDSTYGLERKTKTTPKRSGATKPYQMEILNLVARPSETVVPLAKLCEKKGRKQKGRQSGKLGDPLHGDKETSSTRRE